MSFPAVGAWIEVDYIAILTYLLRSLPIVGAWIEVPDAAR